MKSGNTKCFHCSEEMDRSSFSVEHKVPWRDSQDPVNLFFDLENISYSHLSCNSRASRKPWQKYKSEKETKENHLRTSREWKEKNRIYDPIERKERYKRLRT